MLFCSISHSDWVIRMQRLPKSAKRIEMQANRLGHRIRTDYIHPVDAIDAVRCEPSYREHLVYAPHRTDTHTHT